MKRRVADRTARVVNRASDGIAWVVVTPIFYACHLSVSSGKRVS